MSSISTETKTVETVPTTISSLVGREVYTAGGNYLGEVEDLRLDFSNTSATHLVLENFNTEILENPSKKDGYLIPYRWIQSVGDIIIISQFVESVLEDLEEN